MALPFSGLFRKRNTRNFVQSIAEDPVALSAIADALSDEPGSPIVVARKTDTTLSTAQIAALHTTGIVCVPAPGVGKKLLALAFGGRKVLNSVAFSGSPELRLVYGTDGTDATLFAPSSVISATSDKDFTGVQPSAGLVLATSAIENKPLCVKLPFPANVDDSGPISTFDIGGTNGEGYEVLDEVAVIQNGSGDDATIIVDTVDGTGGILTAHLGTPGTGYAVQPAALTAPEGGASCGIDITAITPPALGNGSATVSVIYAEVDV